MFAYLQSKMWICKIKTSKLLTMNIHKKFKIIDYISEFCICYKLYTYIHNINNDYSSCAKPHSLVTCNYYKFKQLSSL